MNDQAYEIFKIDPLHVIRQLDAMPFKEMLLLVTAGVLFVVAVIVIITRLIRGKNVPPISEGAALANDMNAAIYGLILAFLVVSMYDTNRKVEESIAEEANTLVAILYTSQVLDNADQIRAEIKNYTRTVVEVQWPLMRSGNLDAAWKLSPKLLGPLYKTIQEAKPVGAAQDHCYDKLPEMLRDLDNAHRSRLTQADIHLPVQFWRVILLMTILALWFLAYMNPWTGLSSIIPIIIPGVVIALSFSLLISLHYPFLGPFSVSNEPYSRGALDFSASESSRSVDKMPSANATPMDSLSSNNVLPVIQ